MKQCRAKNCKTLWIDPMPKEEDIPKLYEKYSTHTDATFTKAPKTIFSNLLERIRSRYLHTAYDYTPTSSSWVDIIFGLLAYIHPAWKDTQAANIFYLPACPGGTLLDIGCGSGSSMQTMKGRGWSVVGIDFDTKAVDNAKNKGLEVYLGDLSDQNFPDYKFDAIMMNHVIEHVPHPIELLQECRRILQESGTMIVITPNVASRGAAFFGKNWRGLETPHHLQLFTVQSLEQLARNAGFVNVASFSSLQGAYYILRASSNLAANRDPDMESPHTTLARIKKQLVWFILGWIHILLPGRDEVAVIVCKK